MSSSPIKLGDHALAYGERGWRVLPVHGVLDGHCTCGRNCKEAGKHPRIKEWPAAASKDPAKIRAWWHKWPDANVGIATGAGSGLSVLDVDRRSGGQDSLAAMEASHSPLPPTIHVSTGGGGSHFYFDYLGGGLRNSVGRLGQGLDIRSDGGFVVAPPSLHSSGQRYAWMTSADAGEIPAPMPDWLACRLLPPALIEHPPAGLDPAPLPPLAYGDLWGKGAMLHPTLPTGPGQRNYKLLLLARAVKFNLRMKSAADARPIFDEWFRRSLAIITTKDFYTSWEDFRHSFDCARYPLGADLSTIAWEHARTMPVPKVATQAQYAGMEDLIRLCAAFQSIVGDTPFSLSCHQLKKLIGRDQSTCNTWLRGLTKDGVLQCVEKGIPGRPGNRASRWRYLGD